MREGQQPVSGKRLVGRGFTGCGKNALVVILSEAKNPFRLKTKDQEGFFAQTRRSE